MADDRVYRVGIMKVEVEKETDADFHRVVDEAARIVEARLAEVPTLRLDLFEFMGPHLSAIEGSYSPLDFLRLGLVEKLERHIPFLLVITEVDLSANLQAYVLALPSQLTNIAILSTKRLTPSFWGESAREEVTARRLAALMLHTLGHLLNMPHDPQPSNVMYDFDTVEQLETMHTLAREQVALMQRHLPAEAREEVRSERSYAFALHQIRENGGSIWRTVRRANPFRLLLHLPTMLTAAFSLIIVLFFTAEIWDVASTLGLGALTIFSVVSVVAATLALYRAFNIDPGRGRSQEMAESTIVTAAATLLSLWLTTLLLYALFFLLSLLSALSFFPSALKETWPTVDPAVRLLEHVKLGMFLAGMGVLTGSLGAGAERKALIRQILFLDEES